MRWCSGIFSAAAMLAMLLDAQPCLAHHVPGHGASEGARVLNSFGQGAGLSTSRLMLLQEVYRDSQSLNPGTTSSTSLLGEYAPHPWVSFGVQAPLLVVDEDAPGVEPKVGYGDTSVFVRVTPHADKLVHRTLTLGVVARAPTRTVRFEADPGRIWSVAPSVLFTRTYDRAWWQLLAVFAVEQRPAGVALEQSLGVQGGLRLARGFIVGLGLLADLRLATFCSQPGGGHEFCTEGRVTELDREVGSLRLANRASVTWNYRSWGNVTLALQFPLTPRRDYDGAGSLSFQFLF